MASEFFWDTSGLFALLNSDDPAHERARRFIAASSSKRRRSFTTEWVIGECCTLLIARKRSHVVPKFLDILDRSGSLTTIHVDQNAILSTKMFLRKHLDQGYSFTDCTSFVVMRERNILDAMTADAHFEQAGFRALLI